MTVTVTTSGPIESGTDTNLTITEILNNVACEVGVQLPDTIIGNADQTAKELLHFLTKACEEISRRVDWGSSFLTLQLTGDDGDTSYALPTAFSRLSDGLAVTVNGNNIRGGLTNDEWISLPSSVGSPKYFRLTGDEIRFWPYLATSETATISAISKGFTNRGLDVFVADDDKLTIPHEVVEKCVIWRWKRHHGESFEDYFAECEAAIADYSDFDARPRTP